MFSRCSSSCRTPNTSASFPTVVPHQFIWGWAVPGCWGSTKPSHLVAFELLRQLEKSAAAEHALKQAGHEILFQNTDVLDSTSNHYVRLQREAIESHKHQQSFNKKEESLKLKKAWLPALKNTAFKRSTNSTQPQGPVITAHKIPDNDTHQSQWQIISPPLSQQ